MNLLLSVNNMQLHRTRTTPALCSPRLGRPRYIFAQHIHFRVCFVVHNLEHRKFICGRGGGVLGWFSRNTNIIFDHTSINSSCIAIHECMSLVMMLLIHLRSLPKSNGGVFDELQHCARSVDGRFECVSSAIC